MAAKITNNLPQFTRRVQDDGLRGMTQALVLGASEASVMTPIDTSNLINSQFKNVRREGEKVIGTVGYTAEYAAAVHAAKGKLKGQPRPSRGGIDQGTYWGPGGEPQFLKKGFENAKPAIMRELKKSAKTK